MNSVKAGATSVATSVAPRSAPRRMARQAAGYLVVGGAAAVVDIGVFHALMQLADAGLAKLAGHLHVARLLLAAALSFSIAAVLNYLLSSVWLYRRNWRSARRAAMFLLFALVGLGINSAATWWFASHLPILPTVAKIGGVGVAFVANFLMNTLIVFKAEDA
jgi:putative flippase GtrA